MVYSWQFPCILQVVTMTLVRLEIVGQAIYKRNIVLNNIVPNSNNVSRG